MTRIIPALVCLAVGIGWYFGYSRPAAEKQREILRQNQWIRDNLDMTDAEMAEAGAKLPQYFEDMKRQDEMTAVVALAAFKCLERGDTNAAKSSLAWHVGSYYRLNHTKGGDTNLVANIEAAAREYPIIAAEIAKKVGE